MRISWVPQEPGEPRDPETDRIFLLGSLGTGEDPPPVENGRLHPEPNDLRVGETYDFRWMPERPGEYALGITTTFDRSMPAFPRDAPPPHMAELPVRVR